MTRLQIFKRVKEHLIAQDCKAMDKGGECVYLSDTGLKCAVGCLIKPEYYDEKMEGCAVGSLSSKGYLAPSNVEKYKIFEKALQKSLDVELDDDIVNMLEQLQRIHDEVDVDQWENELNYLEQEIINDD